MEFQEFSVHSKVKGYMGKDKKKKLYELSSKRKERINVVQYSYICAI